MFPSKISLTINVRSIAVAMFAGTFARSSLCHGLSSEQVFSKKFKELNNAFYYNARANIPCNK